MRIVAIAIVIVTSTSCATLTTNGTTQRITVTSTPSDAEVFLDGQAVGRTPTQVVVSRRSRDPVIGVTRDGFRPRWERLQRSTSWWLLESIGVGVAGLFGSLLLLADHDSFSPQQHIAVWAVGVGPAAVDYLSGAAFKFPSQVNLTPLRAGRNRGLQEPKRKRWLAEPVRLGEDLSRTLARGAASSVTADRNSGLKAYPCPRTLARSAEPCPSGNSSW